MRALVVRPGPNFSVQDVAHGWVAGLRSLGITTVDFNLDARLTFYDKALRDQLGDNHDHEAVMMASKGIESACYELWPDVVVIVSGFFIPPAVVELIRSRGHKLVLVCTESPYEDDNQVKMAPFYDVVLVNDPTNLERFRERNPNTFYQHHCYDPSIHRPKTTVEPEWRTDFFFAGTGYPSRVAFFEAVNWDGIDAGFAGNWRGLTDNHPIAKRMVHDRRYCIDNTDVADLYAATQASANLYRKEAQRPELSDGWAMGPREVELAATGTFFLTEPRGENREVLPMLPDFDGPGDFEDQLRWWLDHPDERHAAAQAAQAAVADRTFTNAAASLIRTLDPTS